jgi:cytochrome c-type biogenesis protein CcmH/NrfG
MSTKEFARWMEQGDSRLQQEHYEEALDAFEHALQLDPKHALAWGKKAEALAFLHRVPEALAAYDQAVRLNPTNAELVQLKAVV